MTYQRDLAAPSSSALRKQIQVLTAAESFFESSVLFALNEIGVYRALAAGPRSLDALHSVVGGDRESLRGALDAAVALKLLALTDGSYWADDVLLDTLGRPESPSFFGETLTFLHGLARPILELAEVVRSGKPAVDVEDIMHHEEAGQTKSWSTLMTDAMDAYSRGRGKEIAERVDFSSVRTMLDLAAGPGTYAMAICEKYPGVHATLVELPGPLHIAKRVVAERGMTDRISFVEADIITYTPETTFDVLLISNTLHQLGPDLSRKLLRRCFDMVSPGGRIIIQGHLLNNDRTSPRWATLLNLVQRVTSHNGRNHSIGETQAWLREAGFHDPQPVTFSLHSVSRCVIGHRPI